MGLDMNNLRCFDVKYLKIILPATERRDYVEK